MSWSNPRRPRRALSSIVFAAALFAGACDAAAEPETAPDSAAVPPDVTAVDSVLPGPAPSAVDPVAAAWARRVDPGLFTRWGACPFECCVYRDWLAESAVVVRAQPRSTSAIVATIPAGQRFDADTGFVRITSPQIVVVTAPVEAFRHEGEKWTGVADTLAVGDTLLVLENLGEGHHMMTRGADRVSAEQFWAGADGWQPYGGAKGVARGTHTAEWWAHGRTAAGAEGWIDAYASELGNVDACGM